MLRINIAEPFIEWGRSQDDIDFWSNRVLKTRLGIFDQGIFPDLKEKRVKCASGVMPLSALYL